MVIGVGGMVVAALGTVGSSRGASDADVVVTVVMAHEDADNTAVAAAAAAVVVVDDASDVDASNMPHREARPVEEHSPSLLAHCHILNHYTPLDNCCHSQQPLFLLFPTMLLLSLLLLLLIHHPPHLHYEH